jgi:hypothetical protein
MRKKGGEVSDSLYNQRVSQRLSQDADNSIIKSELNIGSEDAISSITNNCNLDSYDSINYFYTFNRGGSSSMKNKEKNINCDCKKKGGCMTCPKGVKNINVYFQTFHIIIPRLYNKYKSSQKKKIGGYESSAYLDLSYLDLTTQRVHTNQTFSDNSSTMVDQF